MARYDKYEPLVSGGRGRLAVDWLPADLDKVVGVGINSSGLIVKGAGQTGVIGVLILTMVRKAGDVVDIMRLGEVVDFDYVGRPRVAFAAATPGSLYYAAANGDVSKTASGGVYVGHTREKSRLMVDVRPGAVA